MVRTVAGDVAGAPHLGLDGIFRDELVHMHRFRLTNTTTPSAQTESEELSDILPVATVDGL